MGGEFGGAATNVCQARTDQRPPEPSKRDVLGAGGQGRGARGVRGGDAPGGGGV